MKTKGSTSFVHVSLEELNRILQPHATIVVKKSFAKELGFALKDADMTLSKKAEIKPEFESIDQL